MPSRISGACNGCRTKKQKCSGDRSGCTQCASATIICTWPEQRKRGPAKGYIEGLEHRLHDAETLLLQLLPLVSPEQLASAASASQNGLLRDSPEPGNRSSPPTLNKKTGIDYWDRFPLDTVENIRRWQQDCALQSHIKDETRTGSNSRPGSVDFSSQQYLVEGRTSSISSQAQYHSMGNGSLRGSQDFSNISHGAVSRLNGVPPQTSSFAMQSQPAFADPSSWQQQQHSQQNSPQHVQHNGVMGQPQRQSRHLKQQQQNAQQAQQLHMSNQLGMPAPMDVDNNGGFFSGEVKRHLFW